MKRIVLFLVFLLFGAAAQAQSCSATVSGITFGPIAPATTSVASITGTVNITCTPAALNPPVRVCLNFGTGGGGTSYSPRLATTGTGTIQYNLYSDAGYSTIWGSRASGTFAPVAVDLTFPLGVSSVSRSVTIYARTAPGQTALVAGNYSSVFFGTGSAEMDYTAYVLLAPDCSTVTSNATALSFLVVAPVINDCSLSATNINFGASGVLNGALTATGTLSVACTNNDSYSIALSAGSGTGASVADRRMTKNGGTEQVKYQLYTNASFSTPWGDGTNGTSVISAFGTGSNQGITVYGRVPPQTTPSAGTYTDTIVATITY
ncbi:spore coat protein U domain-containing protein [Caballeronia sp. LZ035]|uniref:Csu type fimbrial protein n=1 Tax=Caballeronia sp. LZ035 TaxID=3038568 RepID=UPI0028660BBC|nr:spore coat protein U domain-containing protein [Caballeronia sp. LZ035]MDR5760207.1 spore coat protein U domain-containing protein [Caballeronia sp. LZ035]